MGCKLGPEAFRGREVRLMFAPVGFRLFEEVQSLIFEAAFAKWPMGNGHVKRDEYGGIDWQGDTTTLHILHVHWLLARLMNYGPTEYYIASHGGLVLKASDHFFGPTIWQEEFSKMLDHREPTYESFDTFESLYKAFGLIQKPQFRFFEPETGLIRLLENEDGEVDASGLAEGVLDGVAAFQGWSVCFKDGGFPQNSADLNALEVSNFEPKNRRNAGGRPPMARRAALTYLGKYPHGHSGKTWVQIENELGFKAKTIRNGLKEMDWQKPE